MGQEQAQWSQLCARHLRLLFGRDSASWRDNRLSVRTRWLSRQAYCPYLVVFLSRHDSAIAQKDLVEPPLMPGRRLYSSNVCVSRA